MANFNPRSLLFTLQALLVCVPEAAAAAARYQYPKLAQARHAQAQARPKRQAPLVYGATPTIYTEITPSPGADPIPITSQSQVITSFVPQITVCAMSLVPESLSVSGNSTFYRALSYGTGASAGFPTATGTGAPIPPYPLVNQTRPDVSYSVAEGCSTAQSPTVTTVCATTLHDLVNVYTVSRCDQAVTFSSQYGYALSVPAGVTDAATLPPSDIQTLTTYWQAPWQSFTAGAGIVPQDVTERVCSVPAGAGAGQQCVDIREVWATHTVTVPTTTSTHIVLTTTLSEPGRVIVETYTDDFVGSGAVFSLDSTMVLEYSTESVATDVTSLARSTGPASAGAGVTTSETVSVYPASATAGAE